LPEKLKQAENSAYTSLVQQDITQTWDFTDANFDAVVCGQVLEHLGDKALSEMYRVHKPGGLALIGTPVFPAGGTHQPPDTRPQGQQRARPRATSDPATTASIYRSDRLYRRMCARISCHDTPQYGWKMSAGIHNTSNGWVKRHREGVLKPL